MGSDLPAVVKSHFRGTERLADGRQRGLIPIDAGGRIDQRGEPIP